METKIKLWKCCSRILSVGEAGKLRNVDARGLLFNFFLKKSKVLEMGWLSANDRLELI